MTAKMREFAQAIYERPGATQADWAIAAGYSTNAAKQAGPRNPLPG